MATEMKQRYRMFRRGWGVYYSLDTTTGRSKTLETRCRHEAERCVHAMNEAEWQPILNRQNARAYLMASDPAALERTWQFVMDEKCRTVKGATLTRWHTAIDALSCHALHPDARCLSTAGARPESAWLADLLAQGGTICCGFDLDATGDAMAQVMIARHPAIQRLRPSRKDWNDVLRAGG